MLMFDFEPATNIKNFILTCKRAQVIGDPFLYRSVLLGRISDIESFTFFGRSIREGKAHFVKTLEIPDSFPIQTSSTDALMGQSFLGSLINLRELIILQQCEIPFFLIDHPPSTAAPMTLHINQSSTIIITPPNTTFWTAAMFENLPFQLKDLVGTFSNPKTSSALFGAQSSIRRWASIGDLPKQMLKWAVPALQAISFVVGSSIHGSSMQETMSIADLPFCSRLQELGIRGIGRSDLIGDAGLLSFAKITSLSIEMWKCPEVTQEGMLTDIMKCAPELSHLTFKTIGNGAKVTGARRQKIMVRLAADVIYADKLNRFSIRTNLTLLSPCRKCRQWED